MRTGDSTAMMISERMNSSALLASAGMKDSSPWTSPMSLIERLTIWPVSIRFCCGPSIRDSALKTSARMSYCTSSDSRPEENRRAKVVM